MDVVQHLDVIIRNKFGVTGAGKDQIRNQKTNHKEGDTRKAADTAWLVFSRASPFLWSIRCGRFISIPLLNAVILWQSRFRKP